MLISLGQSIYSKCVKWLLKYLIKAFFFQNAPNPFENAFQIHRTAKRGYWENKVNIDSSYSAPTLLGSTPQEGGEGVGRD